MNERTIDPAEEAALIEGIDRWVEREVKPVVMKHDHGDIWPAELVEQMRDMGLFGATISKEYGGLGLPVTTYSQIVMRIARTWMAITGIFNSHLMMAAAVERSAPKRRRRNGCHASPVVRSGAASRLPNPMPAPICRRSA